MAALSDVRKKWHIPPSFGVEFIGYYLDRISRSKEMKVNLQQQLELNKNLLSEQQVLRDKYDEVMIVPERRDQLINKIFFCRRYEFIQNTHRRSQL